MMFELQDTEDAQLRSCFVYVVSLLKRVLPWSVVELVFCLMVFDLFYGPTGQGLALSMSCQRS